MWGRITLRHYNYLILVYFPYETGAQKVVVVMGKKAINVTDFKALCEWVHLLEVQMKKMLNEDRDSRLEWEELEQKSSEREEPPTFH